MSIGSPVLRGKLGRWTAACAVLLAITAGTVPAASAATSSSAKTSSSAHTDVKTTGGKSAKTDVKTTSTKNVKPDYTLPEQTNLNGAFVPISPTRVLDTRTGVGTQGRTGPVGQGPISLDLSGITGNSSVQPTAVVLNVTVVDPTQNTYVEVYPTGNGPTGTSNLNVRAGQTIANQVTVQVGVNGLVDFYNADGKADILADLAGYYTLDKAASNYVADGPARLLDTRSGTGGVTGPVGPGQSVALQVTGVKGVPATGVSAVVLNVTAVDPTKSTYLTVYPDGVTRPATSSLNATAGVNLPNLVTVQVGADGEVDFYNNGGDVNVLADLAGYYVSGSPQAGAVFKSAGPVRILDTRSGTGGVKAPVGPNSGISLQVAGNNGVPSAGVTAVVLNVTVVSPTKSSYLTVYPDGVARPATSNLNFSAGQTIPNLVVVPLGADGKADFYNNSGDTEVLADLFGYYVAGSNLGLSAVSFSSPTLDAAAGGAAQTVNFTVTDSDPAATGVYGEVVIRQFGTKPDTYVGQPLEFEFTEGSSAYNGATFVSGTPASSTYSYTFGVPEYAGTATDTWGVNLVSIYDYPGQQQTVLSGSALSGLSNTFTATEQVSTVTPNYQTLTVTTNNAQGAGPLLYNGTDGFAQYSIDVQDSQSGVWDGSLTVTGPGGITVNAPFAAYADPSQVQESPCQGDDQVLVDEQQFCAPTAVIPAGAPSGTWTVTAVSLTNNAGQTQDYTGLSLAPITVTSDSQIQASGFKLSATQVDDWRQSVPVTFDMDITGAQGGVSAVTLFTFDSGSGCSIPSTTPTENADGSYSVAITVKQLNEEETNCTIQGVEITDGAGDISLYGTDFTPGNQTWEVANTPDTTPPAVTAASLNVITMKQSQIPTLGSTVDVLATAKVQMAPLFTYDTYLYDSSGDTVGQTNGSFPSDAGAQLELGVDVPTDLAVGTYTVAFTLTDLGFLTTGYGGNQGGAVPGGPLTLTITAG